MTCMTCGFEERQEANFCSHCGRVMAWRVYPGYGARLMRPQEGRMIAGVCAGLAQHYGWDVSLTRILLVLAVLCTGLPLVAYLIAWIVIPNAPYMMVMPAAPQPAGTMSR
jgi:phage shock protein C